MQSDVVSELKWAWSLNDCKKIIFPTLIKHRNFELQFEIHSWSVVEMFWVRGNGLCSLPHLSHMSCFPLSPKMIAVPRSEDLWWTPPKYNFLWPRWYNINHLKLSFGRRWRGFLCSFKLLNALCQWPVLSISDLAQYLFSENWS